MQEFTTPQPHQFSIDGEVFYLPAITLADLDAASRLDELNPQDRIKPFRDFIATRVRPARAPWWFGRSRGRRGALLLNIVQLMKLWDGWVGLPGEAQGSPVGSSPSTEASSPTISAVSTPSPSGMSEGTNSEL